MSSVDREAAERALTAFLCALGQDPRGNPDLLDTPARVTQAFLEEYLTGHATDLAQLISSGLCTPHQPVSREPVVVGGLVVHTMCPHHLLPGLGRATVAYCPGAHLLGVGTVARVVDACARRLTLQEAIVQNVVSALMEYGKAQGAYCRVDMYHTCLSCRGARQPLAVVTAVASDGVLRGAEAEQRVSRLATSGVRLP